MQRQRPAGRIVDAEDLDIAEIDDQLTDTRRVLLHRGPPRNWCVSTPILEAPNPTIADPVPAHFRRALLASWENSPGGFKAPDPSWPVGRVLRGVQFGSQGPAPCRESAAGDVEVVGDAQGLVGFVLAETRE